MPETVVEMRGITKAFPGVVANDHVDFTARRGEIHALLGENGAGKSTLMNILAGLYRPDEGEILIEGRPAVFQSPRDAIARRIGMIHQHFRLVRAFTVTENIALGWEGAPVFLNRRKLEQEAAALAARYGMPVDPQARVWQLSVGEQQRVEILKALHRRASILILDEPTAVLTPQESARLFDTLREMSRQGCTVVIITHKLAEVVEVAHRVTVLRKGRLAGVVEEDGIHYAGLSRMMVGEEIETAGAPEGEPGRAVLEAEGLTAVNDKGVAALDRVGFTVRAGEILGVAGVAGNGQRELGEVLAGLRPALGGTVRVDGRDITNRGPRAARQAGLSFVPEDRLGTGLVGNMDAADNFLLRDYRNGGPLIPRKAAEERARQAIIAYGIDSAGPSAPVRMMSGGNLQKLLLAREIGSAPKAMILSYPVRGLDVGATEMVYRLMLEQRRAGCAILFISEDIDALLKYADRVLVLYRGAVTGLVPRESARLLQIGMMMMGTSMEKEARHEVFSHF